MVTIERIDRSISVVVGYYQFDEHEASVMLALQRVWDEDEMIQSDHSEAPYVPANFYRMADACYEHTYQNPQDARDALEKAGWVEQQLF